jgi:hypothetical protein
MIFKSSPPGFLDENRNMSVPEMECHYHLWFGNAWTAVRMAQEED